MFSIRILCGITLAVVYMTVIFISYAYKEDIFAPLSFYIVMHFIRYVPVIIDDTVTIDSGYSFADYECARLTLLEIASCMMVVVGYLTRAEFTRHGKPYVAKTSYCYPQYVITIVFALGLFGRYQYYVSRGGLLNVLHSMGNISFSSSGSGTGSSSFLQYFMTAAIAMQLAKIGAIKESGKGKYRESILFLIIMTTLAMLSYLIIGKRSGTLAYLLLVIIGWNYLVKPIDFSALFSLRSVLLIVFGMLVITLAPSLRTGANTDFALRKLFAELSYAGRDMAVYKYFENHRYWLGSSYITLFTALVPSSLWVGKPIVDDGVYLLNIISGYDVNPPMSANEVPMLNSYPFSSEGALYANFGIIGVVLFQLFFGYFLYCCYDRTRFSKDVLDVGVYFIVLTTLELTSLGLFQTLFSIMMLIIALKTADVLASLSRRAEMVEPLDSLKVI